MAEIKNCPRFLDWIPVVSLYASYRHYEFGKALKKEQKTHEVGVEVLSNQKTPGNEYARAVLVLFPVIGNGIAATIDGVNWVIRSRKNNETNETGGAAPQQSVVDEDGNAAQHEEPEGTNAEPPEPAAVGWQPTSKKATVLYDVQVGQRQKNENSVNNDEQEVKEFEKEKVEGVRPLDNRVEELKEDAPQVGWFAKVGNMFYSYFGKGEEGVVENEEEEDSNKVRKEESDKIEEEEDSDSDSDSDKIDEEYFDFPTQDESHSEQEKTSAQKDAGQSSNPELSPAPIASEASSSKSVAQQKTQKETLFESFDEFASPEGLGDIREILGLMLSKVEVVSWARNKKHITVNLSAPISGTIILNKKTTPFKIPQTLEIDYEEKGRSKTLNFNGKEKILADYIKPKVPIVAMNFNETDVTIFGKYIVRIPIKQSKGEAKKMWRAATWESDKD